MIQVSVTSTEVRNQAGVSKQTQKPYNMNFQTVWMHLYDRAGNKNPYPEKAEVILDRDQAGLPVVYVPGEYQLHPSSIYMDRNGNPALAPRLIPLRKPA